MGISAINASAILNAHKNQPIRGDVLVCGRQTVSFTPEQAVEIVKDHGLTPQLTAEECELDLETRLSGEMGALRGGETITDRSFFRLIGVDNVVFLDHTDYEGAELIFDLNEELPNRLENKYDFIIDGGVLDNVFNPPQMIMNMSRMLKSGGRLLTYNLYSNHFSAYTMLPHQWYLDYFALNRFAFAQVYFVVHGQQGGISVYQVNLKKRANMEWKSINFPIIDPVNGIGSIVYASKGEDSTWFQQASQDVYRPVEEWDKISPIYMRFAANMPRIPLIKSNCTQPIFLPGGDDFQYIALDGKLITQANIEVHDVRLRQNLLRTMRRLSAARGDLPWAILDTEKLFYQLCAESAEARSIVERENLTLFDARMLTSSVVIGNARKEIYPAAAAMMLDIPIVVISTDPRLDVLWHRMAKYFRHADLIAGCMDAPSSEDLVKYGAINAPLSQALEYGDYQGSPRNHIPRIAALFDSMF